MSNANICGRFRCCIKVEKHWCIRCFKMSFKSWTNRPFDIILGTKHLFDVKNNVRDNFKCCEDKTQRDIS